MAEKRRVGWHRVNGERKYWTGSNWRKTAPSVAQQDAVKAKAGIKATGRKAKATVKQKVKQVKSAYQSAKAAAQAEAAKREAQAKARAAALRKAIKEKTERDLASFNKLQETVRNSPSAKEEIAGGIERGKAKAKRGVAKAKAKVRSTVAKGKDTLKRAQDRETAQQDKMLGIPLTQYQKGLLRPVGATSTLGGKKVRWNGRNWVPVEQKKKQETPKPQQKKKESPKTPYKPRPTAKKPSTPKRATANQPQQQRRVSPNQYQQQRQAPSAGRQRPGSRQTTNTRPPIRIQPQRQPQQDNAPLRANFDDLKSVNGGRLARALAGAQDAIAKRRKKKGY